MSGDNQSEVRFFNSGDTALVVEFGDRVDRALSERVLNLSSRVRESSVRGVRETVPTYRSLLVHYDPLTTDSATLGSDLRKLLEAGAVAKRATKLWRIPACFATSHAPDLEDVAQRTGLPAAEVVRIQLETVFHVYMVGFSPGFPYLGDVPEALALPRRTDPRVKVPAGSIAIAGTMAGIYPVESPGGWHLIGTTPIRLFDMRSERPALLSPGDKVGFEAISAGEFDSIHRAIAADDYRVACEMVKA